MTRNIHAFGTLKATSNRVGILSFLIMLVVAGFACQPIFILLRDQLIAFQLSTLSLTPGIPTPDDLILRPATTGFIEKLRMTWVILTLPTECQIWLAQSQGTNIFFTEIESISLKKSLWARAVILSVTTFLVSAAVALWLRHRYLARVSNPIVEMNSYIAALADDPRQLLAPLSLENAPDELVQTASRLNQLGSDIRLALRQKDRLADIGTAVAKINHDLRNILSAATLVSDALENSNDPRIRSVGPVIGDSYQRQRNSVSICWII